MCNAFAARGWSVDFYGIRDHRADAAPADDVVSDAVSLHLRESSNRRFSAALQRYRAFVSLFLRRPAFVHSRDDVDLALASARAGRSTSFELHTNALQRFSRARRRKLHCLLSQKHFRKLVVTSEVLRKALADEGVPESQMVVLSNAFRRNTNVRKANLGAGFHVGYVGHLYPGKGMELIEKLVQLCPFATFHIVGGTDADVASWRAALSEWPNVRFYGHVSENAAAEYRDAMDVLLLPMLRSVTVHRSVQENAQWTMPIKLFEYMAAGKPVIASDFAVMKEVVRHNHNGLLCSPEAPEQWAMQLRNLCEDAGLRERLGAEARETTTRLLSWDDRATAIERLHLGPSDTA
jgi:glycosyltransferase involved in cell wall biosynthesis